MRSMGRNLFQKKLMKGVGVHEDGIETRMDIAEIRSSHIEDLHDIHSSYSLGDNAGVSVASKEEMW